MPKDDRTWLNMSYIFFALLITYIAWNFFDTVGIQTGWQERYDQWYIPGKNILSIIIGALSAIWLRAGKERNDYFLASIAELRKVSWPNFEDTRRMTIIVCIVVGIFAIILGIFDTIWSKLLKIIIA